MSDHSDVQLARLTATGTLVARPCRLRNISIIGVAAAGTLVFRDGGASGAVKGTLDVGAGLGTQSSFSVESWYFSIDCHVTMAAGVFLNATHS